MRKALVERYAADEYVGCSVGNDVVFDRLLLLRMTPNPAHELLGLLRGPQVILNKCEYMNEQTNCRAYHNYDNVCKGDVQSDGSYVRHE